MLNKKLSVFAFSILFGNSTSIYFFHTSYIFYSKLKNYSLLFIIPFNYYILCSNSNCLFIYSLYFNYLFYFSLSALSISALLSFSTYFAARKSYSASANYFFLGSIISITSKVNTTALIHTDKLPAAEDALKTFYSLKYYCLIKTLRIFILFLFRFFM